MDIFVTVRSVSVEKASEILLRRVELDEKGCIFLVTFRTSWKWHMPDRLPNDVVTAKADLPSLLEAQLLLFISFQPDQLHGGNLGL